MDLKNCAKTCPWNICQEMSHHPKTGMSILEVARGFGAETLYVAKERLSIFLFHTEIAAMEFGGCVLRNTKPNTLIENSDARDVRF